MARVVSPAVEKAILVLTTTFVAVVVISALYWAQTVFIPLALALFLSFVLSPLLSALERWRLGRVPAVVVVITLTTLVLVGTVWLVVSQVNGLLAELPQYSGNITGKVRSAQEWFQGPGTSGLGQVVGEIKQELGAKPNAQPGHSAAKQPTVTIEPDSPPWLSRLPSYLSPAVELLGGLALAVVLVVFILLKREDLRNRFIRLAGRRRLTATTKAVDDAAERVSRFLLMQLIVNASYGLILGVGLFLIGVKYAPLWGFLAAVLRYIPYVGAWIAAVLPVGLSLAMFEGWWQPLLVIGFFLVLELASNNIMEPWLYGQSMGVSEVALLVSAAFWAFLWGPVGMVLSAPMTVCLVVMGRHVPRLRFLDVILGDEPPLDPDVVFYQRLLADDRDEATEIVRHLIKERSAEEVYDALLVPALTYAKRDRERDELDDRDEQHLLDEARAVMEELEDRGLSPTPEKGAATASGVTFPRVRVLTCPARDQEDELAQLFPGRLLDPAKWDVEAVGGEVLTGELIAQVEEKKVAVLCIVSLPPGGLSHARYLCKKLRARFPAVKLLVGRWGLREKREGEDEQLQAAGADKVTTGVLETREQLDVWLPMLREGEEAAGRARVA